MTKSEEAIARRELKRHARETKELNYLTETYEMAQQLHRMDDDLDRRGTADPEYKRRVGARDKFWYKLKLRLKGQPVPPRHET